MSLEQDAERGRLAQQWLDSPVYQEAIEGVRKGILDAWAASPIRDKEGQHELKLMLKLLDDLITNIRQVVDTGTLARIEIDRGRDIAARLKRWMR